MTPQPEGTTAGAALANPLNTEILEDLALESETTLDGVKLNGKKLTSVIDQRILSASDERTMEGASTLSLQVSDPDYTLLNSGILNKKCTTTIDDIDFSLVQVSKSGTVLDLVFEDAVVQKLRGHKKPLKAYRDKITRLGFAAQLCREAGVPFRSTVNLGFTKSETIKVHGKRGDKRQRSIIETFLRVAEGLDTPSRVMIAGVACMTHESQARNNKQGRGKRAGVFNQKPSNVWGTLTQVRNVERISKIWIQRATRIYRDEPSIKLGELARETLANQTSVASYNRWLNEARATLSAYLGETIPQPSKRRRSDQKRYAFTRGLPSGEKGENSWDCLQRLADEVGWRCFVYHGEVWFISEPALFKAQPRHVLGMNDEAVLMLDFDFDIGKPVSEMSIVVQAGRYQLPVGSVVKIEDAGVANGRWIVSANNRNLFTIINEITLKKPMVALPEPTGEDASGSSGSSGSSGDLGSLDARVARVYEKAQQIHDKKYPYVWGGGHGAGFAPNGGGYDCSGSVSAVLAAGGFLTSPRVSGAFESFGVSGKGKYFTIYANSEHMFMEFTIPGKGTQHFGTGRWGKSWSGAGFNPSLHPHGGFVARHVKGL